MGSGPDPTSSSNGGEVDDLPIVRKPFDQGRVRETWRGRLAAALVGLLALTIMMSFVAVSTGRASAQEVNDLLDRFLTGLVGLTGTALGFYFGGKTRDV